MEELLPWDTAPASAGHRDVLWAEVRIQVCILTKRSPCLKYR